MSDLQERISQFRKMANDDPDNELGHYRLGQLLMEAGQHGDAIPSLQRALQISPQFAKVYQLLAECYLKLDKKPDAVKVLNEGFGIADAAGHFLPRDEMGRMLSSLGEAVPATKSTSAETAASGGFRCQRPGCMAGSRARQLPKPPLSDAFGKRIFETVCADCWNDWLRNFSVKVINELRLDLSTEHGQAEYDRYMMEFFGFT
jgi:tetratricopeptide (TPR) repeat protein